MTRELNSLQLGIAEGCNYRTIELFRDGLQANLVDASDQIRLGYGRDCRICQINAVATREIRHIEILHSKTIRCNCIIIAVPCFRGFRVSTDRCIALQMLLWPGITRYSSRDRSSRFNIGFQDYIRIVATQRKCIINLNLVPSIVNIARGYMYIHNILCIYYAYIYKTCIYTYIWL